jgi:hypothetical protein
MAKRSTSGLVLPGDGVAFGMTYGELLTKLRNDLPLDASGLQAGTIEQMLAGDTVWNNLAYNTTNWQDFDSTQATWRRGQYARDPLGFVHIRGLIKSVAAWATATVSTQRIATLPVGFRPGKQELGMAWGKDTASQVHILRLDVTPLGDINLNGATTTFDGLGASNGNESFMSLILSPFIQVN